MAGDFVSHAVAHIVGTNIRLHVVRSTNNHQYVCGFVCCHVTALTMSWEPQHSARGAQCGVENVHRTNEGGVSCMKRHRSFDQPPHTERQRDHSKVRFPESPCSGAGKRPKSGPPCMSPNFHWVCPLTQSADIRNCTTLRVPLPPLSGALLGQASSKPRTEHPTT